MAESSWTQSFVNFFRIGAARGPESYLKFSRQCLEEVRTMTLPRESKSSQVINYEQCVYLVDRLDKAIHKASLSLELRHLIGGREGALEHLKILCMLAKKVRCFIQGCCDGHWLQAAVMSTNLSDCTVSLGFEMRLFEILLPPWTPASTFPFSLFEISALRHGEGELVKTLAFMDDGRLVTKLRAFIQCSKASNDELELPTFLLERLDRFKQSLPLTTSGSLQSTLHERDLTNLKDMVQIGRGGYGTVHKASWLGIDVAVKTFFGTDNPDFKKEVPILAGLSHPNIVSFFCHGKDMGECCIVMELMDGDLFSLVKKRQRSNRTQSCPFSLFEQVDLMLQIAEAMDYLHEMRVLHRDLKSHNILVRWVKPPNAEGYENVQVKVSDFGLSRTKEFSMTQSHMTPNTGTARWMAPELIKFQNTNGGIETAEGEELVENYPFKCDVYSFGMVCLEILTGDVPFPNMTPNDVKRAVCAGERPQLPDRCHEKLKALIEKCWNPESNILGRGDFSVVHQGILADSRKVAVKLIEGAVTRLGLEFFEFELGGWRFARHRHLVEMLGYCFDDDDFLLVNEYMSGGTLDELLFKYYERAPPHPFTWKRRLKIAMDIAQALEFICGIICPRLETKVFGYRLKSSDVFLDDDSNAKVSGSGQTRRGAVSWLPQGATPSGGMTPNYTRGGVQTKEDHVYNFGVVLMELLIGCPSVNEEPGLVTWFRELVLTQVGSAAFLASKDLCLALGLNFYLDEFMATESMLALVGLAMDCSATDPDVRPDIDQVLRDLRDLV